MISAAIFPKSDTIFEVGGVNNSHLESECDTPKYFFIGMADRLIFVQVNKGMYFDCACLPSSKEADIRYRMFS